MNAKLKKLLIIAAIAIFCVVVLLIIVDKVIMPSYVSGKIVTVPDVTGMHKDSAMQLLKELNLNPRLTGPRYDERYEIDHVMFQKPEAGREVKENRRVYLHISGGEPLVKMPNLIGKTFRDAKVTLERRGLFVRKIEEVKSELPANTIVDQEFEEGTNLANGDSVLLQVSIGPNVGMIRVPNIIAKSVRDAERILRNNNLKMGKITYIVSPTLLTNTIISQYPSEDYLLSVGDSVDVVVAKSKTSEN